MYSKRFKKRKKRTIKQCILKGVVNMYFKTFDKLNRDLKVKILSELGFLYDLTTERGVNSLKKEFKYIEPQIKDLMIEKGLYKR